MVTFKELQINFEKYFGAKFKYILLPYAVNDLFIPVSQSSSKGLLFTYGTGLLTNRRSKWPRVQSCGAACGDWKIFRLSATRAGPEFLRSHPNQSFAAKAQRPLSVASRISVDRDDVCSSRFAHRNAISSSTVTLKKPALYDRTPYPLPHPLFTNTFCVLLCLSQLVTRHLPP